MKKTGGLFTTAYLFLMFCVYPFYMKEGYVDIGEAKYKFFLYGSLGMIGILCVILLLSIGRSVYGSFLGKRTCLPGLEKISVSSTDAFVCLYLASVSVSSVFSKFRQTAIWGTEGWHIGLVLWAVLCGVYFLISRLWKKEVLIRTAAVIASAVVFLLGILDSFSFYLIPLDVREAGFISTLGNINWFCGYLSVLAPVGICSWFFERSECGDLHKKRKILRKAAGIFYTLLAFSVGLCQGSNGIFLWFGGLFFVLLWIGAAKRVWLANWFFMVFLWGLSAQIIRLLRLIFPGRYNYELDNLCGYFTGNSLSLWIGAAGFIIYLLLRRSFIRMEEGIGQRQSEEETEPRQKEKESYKNQVEKAAAKEKKKEKDISCMRRKRIRGVLIILSAAGILGWVILSAVHTWTGRFGFLDAGLFVWNESWGNGRGAALKAGFSMFREMSPIQKLIGVGPDCFADYAYSIGEVAAELRSYFGASRLTNAHCEIATSLINTGILGTMLYMGIFWSFIRRCFKCGAGNSMFYMPAVCVICYLSHNLVSFAQVLNLPFVVLVMAMGESMLRSSYDRSPSHWSDRCCTDEDVIQE